MSERDPATVVARARPELDSAYGGVAPPLWTSDTYRWQDLETKPVFDYSRTVNPNREMLAGVLAELEGAAGGVVTNSGQSAALLALLMLPAGALVLAPHDCYGGTYRLISAFAEQGKLKARFVDMRDFASFNAALDAEPALVWLETPSNPLLRITDIAARAAQARAAGALTLADNTLLTPVLQQPLRLGCELVLHSTTKALNGHADLFGGALLTAEDALVEKLCWWSNAAGLNGGAHDSWQTIRGLRTLPLRIERQQASARAIANWLASHPVVREVNFPELAEHPDYDLAKEQQSGPGFMISFRLSGGVAAATSFLRRLNLITLASSLGGFASLICCPTTMTHRGMPPEAQREAGLHPDLLRLSVGLEHPDDLVGDLSRALDSG